MSRKHPRPAAQATINLDTCHTQCWICDTPLWMAYTKRRKVMTLDGLLHLHLPVRCCQNPACARYHRPYRPEEEGHYALPHGEFGLDVIARVGQLRFVEHKSVPEIHAALSGCGVVIAERSVTEQLRRYEELVALRLADQERLHTRLTAQGQVILALDGLQPDVGHEVLWVLRDCLSGEILLARSLLSATEADRAPLIAEVRDALPGPIRGVISDGQHSIRNAVARALPGIPHQLCQFHYLREAAKPISEADRHAKKELKKHVRGVRPIERALEARDDAEAEIIRGSCLAVRSVLTDDGRPPLGAAGLQLHDRLTAISASLERVAEKRGALLPDLAQLHKLLTTGRHKTAELWVGVEQAYAWVHRAAHLLKNAEGHDVLVVRQQYRALLAEMAQGQARLGDLAWTVGHVRKVTRRYWPGLFRCDELADLPHTNNELEQCFGSARCHERRVTGRKVTSPTLVVRGKVRLVAALATRMQGLEAEQLRLTDIEQWRTLRADLEERHEARRCQLRFRRDPDTYLHSLEERLLKPSLPA